MPNAHRPSDFTQHFRATRRRALARPVARAVAMVACGLALGVGLPVLAQSTDGAAPATAQRQAFNIPVGSLAANLRSAASEAGVLLSFTPEQTAGKSSPALGGRYTVAEAFATLLQGSGLHAQASGTNAYVLRAQASAADASQSDSTAAATLATVRVVARAAPAPAEADNRYQPTPDASTLRTTAPTIEIPQVVNVVPAQVVRDQRPRNMDDALINVSGITQGNTLAGTQDTLMKRGFGGNRDGSIMRNGMPLVQGRGLNAGAESVEVLKGPSSLLYGLMDPGGVVNVISKKPQLRQRNTLSLSGSGYANSRYGGGATLDSTGPIGENGLAYRLIVDQVNEDYWRNYGKRSETLIAPSLAWYGDDTQAVVWYEYRKFLTPFDRGTALDPTTNSPLDIPKTRRLDEPYNEMRGVSQLLQTSVDHQLGGDWAAHLNLSYDRETYDANQLRINGVNTTRGTLARNNDGTRGSLSTDSYASAYADGSLTLGGLKHQLQYGFDAEYRKIYRKDLLRQPTTSTFSYLNPVYGREVQSTAVSPSDSDQTDLLHNQSLFAQDSIQLNDRWILVASMRWQAWSQRAGRGRPFKQNTNTDGSAWLPRVGVIYKLSEASSVYASYSESLKPSSTIAPLSGGAVINSNTNPESAKSWEIGGKIDLPGRFTGTLAAFDIRKKNVLVSQFNDVTKLTDWRTAGAARSRGMEFDLAGQINSRWSAIASLAYLDAKTTEDPLYAGLRLWNVARNTGSLSVVYNVGPVGGSGQLRLGGGAQYVGKRAGDSANSFELPAYTVANAFASYDTLIKGRKVKFQLNVKNLFDKNYFTSSANRYFVSMGDARQVSLLTSFEF